MTTAFSSHKASPFNSMVLDLHYSYHYLRASYVDGMVGGFENWYPDGRIGSEFIYAQCVVEIDCKFYENVD